MKRSIGLIAAALFTASVYSQNYPDQTAPGSSESDFQSRQSEAGAPASSQSGTSGYERQPGSSGGNSSTGQSSGDNLGSAADQNSFDSSLITPEADLSVSSTSDGSRTESSVGSSRNPSSLNRIGGDPNSDSVFNDEEWEFHHRNMDLDVGGPATSESGQGSSSSNNSSSADSSSNSSSSLDLRGSYLNNENQEWDTQPTFRDNFDPSVRAGTDIPAPDSSDYNQSEDLDVRVYDDSTYSSSSSIGGPAASASGGSTSSDKKDHCDTDKDGKGSAQGTVKGSGSAKDSDERYQSELNDSKYDLNRDASGENSKSSDSGSPSTSDYGDKSSSSSDQSSSSSSSSDQSTTSSESSLTPDK